MYVGHSTIWTCQDMKDRGHTHDGEYDLHILGVAVRVFCYGMNSNLSTPVEYLILNSETDNYSELVHRPR